MSILRDELHTHLYGCIAAEELWEIGKDSWPKHEQRLDWYADEYEKAYKRRPDWRAYWRTDDGAALLKSDFEFLHPAPFSCFQARFNLAIALLPIIPQDPSSLRLPISLALRSQQRAGTRYLELRAFSPPYLNDQELHQYFSALADECLRTERENAGRFIPRIALSLSRDNNILERQYRLLRAFLDLRPDLARAITAIDFCHVEEGFPPNDKAEFFRRVRHDNTRHPDTALAILYHVGESFQGMSLMSAARWVYEAHGYGAHRLGHAIAVGMDPANLAGQQITENAHERRAHLAWLLREESQLAAHGYKIDRGPVQKELEKLWHTADSDKVAFTYDADLIDECRQLQEALLSRLQEEQAIIESCPTSNFRIGQIDGASRHPLPRFLQHDLQVIVSTDDPGIFAVSLASEEALCRSDFGLGDRELLRLQRNAELARSEVLADRVR